VAAQSRLGVQLVQLPLNKTMREQVVAGKMRPLIMSGDRRAPLFPEIPSAGDKGWDIPNNGWQALFTTGGTPRFCSRPAPSPTPR